jgi:Rrf2 family iron-sulfur cluster assembly transcriptional regulator
MHLSTRGRYAIMAMLDLAELTYSTESTGDGTVAVTLAQIAARQNISLSYLEQLFAKLRKAGVVDSIRGPGGGYVLKDPRTTTLAAIIDAVDETIDMTRCGETGHAGPKKGQGCVYGHKCNAHDLWDALGRHIEGFMQRITLQMLIDKEVTPGFTLFGAGNAADAEALEPLRVRLNA